MNIKDVILNVDLINLVKSDVLKSINGMNSLIENIFIKRYDDEVSKESSYIDMDIIFPKEKYYLNNINSFIHDFIIDRNYTYINYYGYSFNNVRNKVLESDEIKNIQERYSVVANEVINDVTSLIYEFYFNNIVSFFIYTINFRYKEYKDELTKIANSKEKKNLYIIKLIKETTLEVTINKDDLNGIYFGKYIEYLNKGYTDVYIFNIDNLIKYLEYKENKGNIYEMDKPKYSIFKAFIINIIEFLKKIPYYPLVDYAMSEDLYLQLLSFGINYNSLLPMSVTSKGMQESNGYKINEYHTVINGKIVEIKNPYLSKIYLNIIYITLIFYSNPIIYSIWVMGGG